MAGQHKKLGLKSIQYGQPIADDGSIKLTDAVVDAIVETGAKEVRLNFRVGNYGKDTAEWYAVYDVIIQKLLDRGLTIIGCINYETLHTPNGQQDWCVNNVENGGTDGSNAYMEALSQLTLRVAQHYEGRIYYWELWNEPNCWTQQASETEFVGGFYIYPSNFAALLSLVYKQLKHTHNVDCEIIAGGMFGHDIGGDKNKESGGMNYITRTYQMGIEYGDWKWCLENLGTYPLDHIGQHIYIDQGWETRQEDMEMYCRWMWEAYTAFEGADTPKKIFITEFGWETPQDGGVSEEIQALNLQVAYKAFQNCPYVVSATWFYLQDEDQYLKFGLYRSGGFALSDRKSAFQVFQMI